MWKTFVIPWPTRFCTESCVSAKIIIHFFCDWCVFYNKLLCHFVILKAFQGLVNTHWAKHEVYQLHTERLPIHCRIVDITLTQTTWLTGGKMQTILNYVSVQFMVAKVNLEHCIYYRFYVHQALVTKSCSLLAGFP